MHELSITQGLLDLVLQHAARAGGGRVTGVHIVSGEMSGIVDDSVQFYWDVISAGTAAAGARLHFRRVPLRFECLACGSPFSPAGVSFDCTACGSGRVRVAAGREFRLDAIDLEDADAPAAGAGAPPAAPGAPPGPPDARSGAAPAEAPSSPATGTESERP
jgi:hydrogenase nickel incorporation protein HypA/HybF